VFATHEIDYANDDAAIAGGHLINRDPPIGCCCFKVWRDGELIYFTAIRGDACLVLTPSRPYQQPLQLQFD